MTKQYDLIILGSGPAGLTAGIYAGRANLNTLIIGGYKFGGQLMQTSIVENFPGFTDGILGPQLMQNMIAQAKKFGAQFINKDVTSVDFSKTLKSIFIQEKEAIKDAQIVQSKEYQSKAVILALGSSPKKLFIKGEDEFWGNGVSTCATCDGFLYKNKIVTVIGGGDSALEEALFLTNFAQKVNLIHRRDEFRASKIMQDKVFKNPRIQIYWNSELKEIIGQVSDLQESADFNNGKKFNKRVESVQVYNSKSNKTINVKTDGVFIAIGHIPNTQLFKDYIKLDQNGYIITDKNMHTSCSGVFVAGDIADPIYKQAITSAGTGCISSLEAQKFLNSIDA